MNKISEPIYDLIPPQEMIQFMLRHSFFHKQVTQIPESVTVDREIDFSVMEQALNLEIERNDCLRLRFIKEKGKLRQYFLSSFSLHNIPVLSFQSKEEQDAFFGKDAKKTVRMLKDETFRIFFFCTFDGRNGIYLNVHHLVMDNAAVFVFFSDLFAVYDHLKDGKPMPEPLGKYEDMIRRELVLASDDAFMQKEKEACRAFFEKDGEPMYLGAEGPKFLEAERRKKKNPAIMAPSLFDPIHDKAELTKTVIPKADSEEIFRFMDENRISGEILVQLAMRLHISKINHRHNDTYFIVLCPRRHNLSEKRAGGTMAAPLPWRIVLPEDLTFREALGKMAQLQFYAFRHMDYPYLEYRKLQQEMYNYPPAAGASTMMFSWLPLEADSLNGWSYEFNGYSMGRYIMVLYTFAMKDAKNGCLKLSCIHRTKFVSKNDIAALHQGTTKALLLGVRNPEMTLGEILDSI